MKLMGNLKEEIYKKAGVLCKVERLEGPKVLIISPHPDDDVLGCGGTICKHIRQGHDITVVYLCNGEKGIKGNKDEKEVARIRKNEAKEAARIMGIRNLVFLEQKDYRIKATKDVVERMKKIMVDLKPNIIYIPWFFDSHRDHKEANRIFAKACTIKTKVCAYEVWTALMPSRIVDITDVWKKKAEAIRKHKSQLNELNYEKAILSLNCYRALTYCGEKMEYAEAFICANAKEYIGLVNKFL
ncbi:PIG-L family deacetylase [Candidatus Woesearchaeota archaeon]|nr:PIG-L family deacetylase [Candidatus Woesearchaeota archaeon]